ncbi:MAG: Hint domain-containing protein [Pseudomonadota bacterium]
MPTFTFIETNPLTAFGLAGADSDIGGAFTVPVGAYDDAGTVNEDGGDDGILEDFPDADLDAQGEIVLADGSTIDDAEFGLDATWDITFLDPEGVEQTVTLGLFQFREDGGPDQFGLVSSGPLPPEGTTFEVVAFNDTPNTNASGIDFDAITSDIACFTAGTLIETPNGPVAVEDLKAGDRVITMDDGPQPLAWIGQRTVDGRGDLAPIHIAEGVLGNDRALALSPCHRVLLQGWRAEAVFNTPAVLAAARSLLAHDGVTRRPAAQVTYYHLMCDRHQIVFANGAPTESMNPSEAALGAMGAAARAEILALFPELERQPPVRPTVGDAEVAAYR